MRDNRISLRVVLIEDNDLLRRMLAETIEGDPGLEVVGDADCGEAGLDVIERTCPDVVIMDSAMPGISGAETTKRLLAASPHVRVIGYSADLSNEPAMRAAGAAAFVVKGSPVDQLVSAIRAARG